MNSSYAPRTYVFVGVWAGSRFEHFLTAVWIDRILRHLATRTPLLQVNV